METIKVEEQLFCQNSEFLNINIDKGRGRQPDSIMRNPHLRGPCQILHFYPEDVQDLKGEV